MVHFYGRKSRETEGTSLSQNLEWVTLMQIVPQILSYANSQGPPDYMDYNAVKCTALHVVSCDGDMSNLDQNYTQYSTVSIL